VDIETKQYFSDKSIDSTAQLCKLSELFTRQLSCDGCHNKCDVTSADRLKRLQ